MSMALGEYKETVPITLITQKRNSVGSTSSEVVALKGARYAVMQEPSKGDKLNEGIMKEITGGDPLQGRALFKDCVTFIPQFKLVVCTNTLLDIGSNDGVALKPFKDLGYKKILGVEPAKNLAKLANNKATYLSEELSKLNAFQLLYPTQGNEVFFKIKKKTYDTIIKLNIIPNLWCKINDEMLVIRFVTSFETEQSSLDMIIARLHNEFN